MSDTYRDKIDLGVVFINISIVNEDGGAHVEVWPDFSGDQIYPPGLKKNIEAWCKTHEAQDWALKQDPNAKE